MMRMMNIWCGWRDFSWFCEPEECAIRRAIFHPVCVDRPIVQPFQARRTAGRTYPRWHERSR